MLLDELRKEPTAQAELAFMWRTCRKLFTSMIFRYNVKLTRRYRHQRACSGPKKRPKEFFEQVKADVHVYH